MKHYPRIPKTLNVKKYKDAIATGFFYLTTGENPERLEKAERVKVEFDLTEAEEKELQDLMNQGHFATKNDAFTFSLQFLHERSKVVPGILTVKFE